MGLIARRKNIRGFWQHGWVPGPLQLDPAMVTLGLGVDKENRERGRHWVARRDEASYLRSCGFKNVTAIGLPIVYLRSKEIKRRPRSLLVMLDPQQSDAVISALAEAGTEYDYASNCLTLTLPRGLDTEAFFLDTLDRISRMAVSSAAREHVTYFIHTERPNLFALRSITSDEDNSDLRWTVDTLADFRSVTRIYEQLHLGDRVLPYREMLEGVRSQPANSFPLAPR